MSGVNRLSKPLASYDRVASPGRLKYYIISHDNVAREGLVI